MLAGTPFEGKLTGMWECLVKKGKKDFGRRKPKAYRENVSEKSLGKKVFHDCCRQSRKKMTPARAKMEPTFDRGSSSTKGTSGSDVYQGIASPRQEQSVKGGRGSN